MSRLPSTNACPLALSALGWKLRSIDLRIRNEWPRSFVGIKQKVDLDK